jgi:hypothetical protein
MTIGIESPSMSVRVGFIGLVSNEIQINIEGELLPDCGAV